MKEKAGAEEGETGSGETGYGETGSGETDSGETGGGETGSGEMGYGETGCAFLLARTPSTLCRSPKIPNFQLRILGTRSLWPALQNSLMQCRIKKVTLCVRRIFAGRAEKLGADAGYYVRQRDDLRNGGTCLRRLKGMMPLRIPTSLTRVMLVRCGAKSAQADADSGAFFHKRLFMYVKVW